MQTAEAGACTCGVAPSMEGRAALEAQRLEHGKVLRPLVVWRRQQLVPIEDTVGAGHEAQRLRQ